MPTPADCKELINYYLKQYHSKYGNLPVVNRHKARWGFNDVLQDLTKTEAKALVDYYLSAESHTRHSLEWFFYNYDKLIKRKSDYEEDAKKRKQLREESKKRLEEWRQRQVGNN